MTARGRDFEQVVFAFVRRLDPKADVRFDDRIPDRDTGAIRQVDVAVRLRLGGHIPILLIVSCKDHNRPLDVGAVEQFIGEMMSVDAGSGVLYSRSGFSAAALSKAAKNRISCCRYFDDAPPESPRELFIEAFAAYPIHVVSVAPSGKSSVQQIRWCYILSKKYRMDGLNASLAEHVSSRCMYHVLEPAVPGSYSIKGIHPHDVTSEIKVNATRQHPPFAIIVDTQWNWFQGVTDAFRLTGSLNVTDGDYLGRTSLPPLLVQHAPDAPGWEPAARPRHESLGARAVFSMIAAPTPTIVKATLAEVRVFGTRSQFGCVPLLGERHALVDQNGSMAVSDRVTLSFDSPMDGRAG